MQVFLTGVSCVGKSAVGAALAELLGNSFFDLDHEIEKFFGTSIERLQNRHLSMRSFRIEAAQALVNLLTKPGNKTCLVAMPPSALMNPYLAVITRSQGISIAIHDSAQSILNRIKFYDLDSNVIEKILTPDEQRRYLKEVKKDITYFGKTYKRANVQVNIEGLDIRQSAAKIHTALQEFNKDPRP